MQQFTQCRRTLLLLRPLSRRLLSPFHPSVFGVQKCRNIHASSRYCTNLLHPSNFPPSSLPQVTTPLGNEDKEISPQDINKKSIKLFAAVRHPSRKEIKSFLDLHLPNMTPESILFFVYLTGRKRCTLSSFALRMLVGRLRSFPADVTAEQVSPSIIRKGFYGLRCYSFTHTTSPLLEISTHDPDVHDSWRTKKIEVEILSYVRYLTDVLLKYPARLSGETVSLVLYGVQGLGSGAKAVRRLLHVLYHKLERKAKHGAFTALEMSQCLYSLKNMSHHDVEVLRLIRVLNTELELLDEPMTAIQLANSFYGLNRMNSYCSEVRALLTTLSKRLQECPDSFNCRQINNIMYGMRGMLGKESKVASCVNVIATTVNKSIPSVGTHEMNSHDVALVGYGMKEMSSRHPEVRQLVASLARLIDRSCNVADGDSQVNDAAQSGLCFRKGLLEPRSVSTCFLGLKNMSSDHVEVRDFLEMLLRKEREGSGHIKKENIWCGRWISNGFFGLRYMSTSHDIVLRAVDFLIDRLKHAVEKNDSGGEINRVMTEMDIALSLRGLQAVEAEHESYRRRAVQILVGQLPQYPYKRSIFSTEDIDEIVHCCRGLAKLKAEHDETQVLLLWVHKQLLVGTEYASSFGANMLTIDMIRSMALGLSQIESNDKGQLLLNKDVRGIWMILCDQLESLVNSTSEAYPIRQLNCFAICDLVRVMRCLPYFSTDIEAASQVEVDLMISNVELVNKWSNALAKGLHLTDFAQPLEIPLNWALQAVSGLEHVISCCPMESEGGVVKLVDALTDIVLNAAPCFEHPDVNVDLRLCHVVDGLRGLQHTKWPSAPNTIDSNVKPANSVGLLRATLDKISDVLASRKSVHHVGTSDNGKESDRDRCDGKSINLNDDMQHVQNILSQLEKKLSSSENGWNQALNEELCASLRYFSLLLQKAYGEIH